MDAQQFVAEFEHIVNAPEGVTRLRELVLHLAITGALTRDMPPIEALPLLNAIRARKLAHPEQKKVVDPQAYMPKEGVNAPEHWAICRLGDLTLTITGGGTPSKSNSTYWGGKIPWASVKDLKDFKYLVRTEEHITEEGLSKSSSNLIPPGRIIVCTRMGLGKIAINRISLTINQDLKALEIPEEVIPEYFLLFYKTRRINGAGMTVSGIKQDDLLAMPAVLPPLEEQKRIVAKVDELMALCDKLEAQQQERESRKTALAQALLTRFAKEPTQANLHSLFHSSRAITPGDLRKAILALAVQGKLVLQDPKDEHADKLCKSDEECAETSSFELPHGWIWARLTKLAEINGGFAFKSTAYTNEGTRIVRISDFDEFGFKDHKVVRHPFSPNLQKFALEEQNILMAMTGGTVGKSYFVRFLPEPMVVNQRVATIKVSDSALPSYVDIVIRSEMTQEAIRRAKNSTNDNISMGDIKGFAIPLPPLAEQLRIVARVDELMALVDKLDSQLAAAHATGKRLVESTVSALTGIATNDEKISP